MLVRPLLTDGAQALELGGDCTYLDCRRLSVLQVVTFTKRDKDNITGRGTRLLEKLFTGNASALEWLI